MANDTPTTIKIEWTVPQGERDFWEAMAGHYEIPLGLYTRMHALIGLAYQLYHLDAPEDLRVFITAHAMSVAREAGFEVTMEKPK